MRYLSLTLLLGLGFAHTLAFAESPNPICKETENGIVKDYYPDGQLKTEWRCQGGHLNGTSKLYYENGTVEKESSYANDARQGVTNSYYESGALKSICNFNNGELDGAHKIFYENGTLKELTFYRDGIEVDENR